MCLDLFFFFFFTMFLCFCSSICSFFVPCLSCALVQPPHLSLFLWTLTDYAVCEYGCVLMLPLWACRGRCIHIKALLWYFFDLYIPFYMGESQTSELSLYMEFFFFFRLKAFAELQSYEFAISAVCVCVCVSELALI